MIDTIISIVSFVWNGFKNLWAFRKRPRLQVYFDPNETYHTRLVLDAGGQGFFCHVMVRNTGKEIARNCRGRLIRVETPGSGRLVGHPDFKNPVTLKWGHEPDFDPRDVEPDMPRRLDVCYARESSPGILSFFTEKRPSGNRTDFPCGVYVVTIRCDGDNLKPIDAQFLIRHQGAWNETEVERFEGKL